MNIRTRITLAMLSMVFLSLIVIGCVTFWYFKVQNDEYHEERLKRKEQAITKDMQYFSKQVELQENMDIVIREFEQHVLEMADIHNLEVKIFNTKGEIMVSSEMDSSFDKGEVPAEAMKALENADRVVIPETEGDRSYMSDYTILRNKAGAPIAILNLPYLRSDDLNIAELREFLGTLLLMYFFLFIGAIGITFWLSNTITKNLKLLEEKLNSVDLNRSNEPLNWHRDDELGRLVDSYNRMLAKLEESRDLLAKTERESAWREMAKQVAHEIKNPLTPMKLSVQHLQATTEGQDEATKARISRTTNMLIEQIDTLSNIASEFSNFAKMPKPVIQKVSVNSVVQSVTDLFGVAPIEMATKGLDSEVYVEMDRGQFVIVLNNLVKNAKQALEGRTDGRVGIEVNPSGQHVEIKVTDNGPGIQENVKDKVFQPSFTTKSGGTGLGLALSKQIVEAAGGSISFETSNEGATFSIVLPRV